MNKDEIIKRLQEIIDELKKEETTEDIENKKLLMKSIKV